MDSSGYDDDIDLETHQARPQAREPDRSSPPNTGTRWRCSVLLRSPSSRSARRIPSARADSMAGSCDDRYPIRVTFFGGCASTATPAITSIRAITESPSHFGFSILDFRLPDRKLEDRIQVFSCICFFPNRESAIENLKLSPDRPDPLLLSRSAELSDRSASDPQLLTATFLWNIVNKNLP